MIGIGENIYLWRVYRGFSQEELSRKAGIPRPNLSAIENGRIEPTLATLRLLALPLNTACGTLANGDAPIHFDDSIFSRKSLENIAQATLGRGAGLLLSSDEKTISAIFSAVIKNKIDAANKIYRKNIRGSQAHIANWLMLKACLKPHILSSILARIDKHIKL